MIATITGLTAATGRESLEYLAPIISMHAEEARQGVASDGEAIYAVDNSVIAKYDIASGKALGAFEADKRAFPHFNSCTIVLGQLVCAASNYPAVPHQGTVEFFDPQVLTHLRSQPMPENPGSLTALDRRDNKWWAVFANYDGRGGVKGQDHTKTILARLDNQFRIEKQYRLPANLLKRIAPHSISGAAWGDGDCLYASGHDKPEIYVLRLPTESDELVHVATFATATFGQAIDIDPVRPQVVWSIDRKTRRAFASTLPKCGEIP